MLRGLSGYFSGSAEVKFHIWAEQTADITGYFINHDVSYINHDVNHINYVVVCTGHVVISRKDNQVFDL